MGSLQAFMPHGMCYMWRWDMLALHVGSDLLIAGAYFSIPAAMIVLLRHRPDIPRGIFKLFVAFIMLCGITHLAAVVVVWEPLYLIQGLLKLATAVVSVITAVVLWPLIPQVIALPSVQQLEQRNAEIESLNKRLATRLESLETLAGGLSHSFNNMLTIINGNVELLRHDLNAEDHLYRLDTIDHTAQRAADMCNKMLAYSGSGHFILTEFDLSRCVEALSFEVPASIQVSRNYQVGAPPVLASERQIGQLLNMLIENAAEAIVDTGRDDGQVTLSVSCVELDEEQLSQSAFEYHTSPGKFVILEIADNGTGMSEDTLERLFEPYFTTRFTGRGLGMSAVQGIVRGHDACLFVHSKEGEGTRIRIAFPAVESETQQYRKPKHHHPKCVLVVDDEVHVLELAANYLRELDIEVHTAATAAGARAIVEKYGDRIDAVLLDYLMPEMTGLELLDEISTDINVDAYLTSGFSRGEIGDPAITQRLAGFIAKPFVQQDFRRLFRPDGT